MIKRQQIEQSGILALQALRKDKFAHGQPFMINSSALPANQCYLEFPDGKILLVKINHNSKDFEKVRDLSAEEQILIKQTLQIA